MNVKVIDYLSPEHRQTIELRNKILREPIGLTYTDQDLEDEKTGSHIACYTSDAILAGCCFLTPYKETTVKLRQMAVDTSCQRNGVGSRLISFAEQFAAQQGFDYIYLHARKEALGFYQKHGYSIESEEFIEVGIPHFEMIKRIKN